MGSMKIKRRKKQAREWVEFQTLHQLSDNDLNLARGIGSPLKQVEELISASNFGEEMSVAARIQEIYRGWQERNAARKEAVASGQITLPSKKKKKPSPRDSQWARAKNLCRLNMEDIRKARELGISPEALIKNIPSATQKWKAPVSVWIRDMYEQRQQRSQSGDEAKECSASHVKHIRCPLVIFGAYDNPIEPPFVAAALVKELQLTNKQVTLETRQFGGFYPSMIEHGIPAAIAWLGELQGIDIKTTASSQSPPIDLPSQRMNSSAKASAAIPDGSGILRLEVTKYVGKNDMVTEARSALKDVNWLIAETACVEKETGYIKIAMQGNTVNTGQLKSVLGEVGMELGHINVTMGHSK